MDIVLSEHGLPLALPESAIAGSHGHSLRCETYDPATPKQCQCSCITSGMVIRMVRKLRNSEHILLHRVWNYVKAKGELTDNDLEHIVDCEHCRELFIM